MATSLRGSANLLGYGLIVVAIVLWQLAEWTGLISLTYVAAPLEIVVSLAHMFSTGEVWEPLLHTVVAIVVAWLLAVCIGIVLGGLAGYFAGVWKWSMASVHVLRTVPAVAIVPVVLLILGYSVQAEIVVAVFVALWPMLMSTAVALRRVHPRLHDVARSFDLGRVATLGKLLLPAAFPAIFVAAKLALTLCVILVVLTEMIGVPQGLGYALVSAQQSLRPADMWAFLVVITAVGLVAQQVLDFTARRAMPGIAPLLGRA